MSLKQQAEYNKAGSFHLCNFIIQKLEDNL